MTAGLVTPGLATTPDGGRPAGTLAAATGWRRAGRSAAVGAGLVAATLLLHFRAVPHLGTRLLAGSGDGASFLWSYKTFLPSVLRGEDPFTTRAIFHPVGADLAFHTGTPLEAVLIGLLAYAVGFTLAVNAVVLAGVVLSGGFTYLLALHETGSRWFSFVAGTLFVWLPWRYGRVYVHHNLVHTWVLPLGLWLLLRFLDRPSRGRAAALGLAVGLAALTDATMLLFQLMSMGLVAGWRWRRTLRRPVLRAAPLAVAVAVLVAAPVLWAMGRAYRNGELDPLPGWGGADIGSLDLLSWVTPPPWHPWWAGPFEGINATIVGGERLGYVGLVVLVLGMAGAVVAARRGRAYWVALTVTFAVLSLGPFLRVNGWTGGRFEMLGSRFSVPLPYLAIRAIPGLNGLRVPARFSVVAALGLCVGVALFLSRVVPRRVLPAVAAGAGVLAVSFVELVPDDFAPMLHPKAPAAYEALAAAPGERAVLEVPIQWRHGFGGIGGGSDQTILLWYAANHGKPIVGGMTARYPQRRLDELLAIAPYRQVLSLQGEPGMAEPATFDAADLRALGIGYVVYHRDRPFPAVLDHIRALGLPVLADDGVVVVFEVPER